MSRKLYPIIKLMSETETNANCELYILNEKNKLITGNFITDLLKRFSINYQVKNLAIFQTAMTHSSYILRDFTNDKLFKLIKEKNIEPIKDPTIAIPLQTTSYERLEYLGDSVIHLILAEYLYNRYPDKDEGFLTKLRTKIENGQQLADLAKKLGLHDYVLLARNIEQIGGRDKNTHIFEDTFEAFIGALYKDSGEDLSLCKKLIVNIVESYIDIAQLIYKETNYKDTLLQYYHKMKWPDPVYKLTGVTDKEGKKIFTMGVSDSNGKTIGYGNGSSKKKGEQIAAFYALKHFGVVNDNDTDDEEVIYQ